MMSGKCSVPCVSQPTTGSPQYAQAMGKGAKSGLKSARFPRGSLEAQAITVMDRTQVPPPSDQQDGCPGNPPPTTAPALLSPATSYKDPPSPRLSFPKGSSSHGPQNSESQVEQRAASF